MESMENERVVKKVYMSELDGIRRHGWPRRKWHDMINECVRKCGMDADVVVVALAPGSRFVVNQVDRRYLAFMPWPILSEDMERFEDRLQLL